MTDNVYERHRYSAVLISHPQLNQFADLANALGPTVESRQDVDIATSRWRTVRFEYLATSSMYSSNRVKPAGRKRASGFAHDMYSAVSPRLSRLEAPVMLVASPYVRLLARLLRQVATSVSEPAPRYVKVDMVGAYEGFSGDVPGLTATRITLSMPGAGDDVEFVSLTGTNPLRSDLRAAVQVVGEPFAVRLEAPVVGESNTKVHIDRHGNLGWYLKTESHLIKSFEVVEALDNLGLLTLGRTLPLDKKPDSEDDE